MIHQLIASKLKVTSSLELVRSRFTRPEDSKENVWTRSVYDILL